MPECQHSYYYIKLLNKLSNLDKPTADTLQSKDGLYPCGVSCM